MSSAIDKLSQKHEEIAFLFGTFKAKKFDKKKDSRRMIAGMANTRLVDRTNDEVSPKSFEKSIPIFKTNPMLRFNHDEGSQVGSVTELQIRSDGLYIEAEIGKGWALADEVWTKIQGGFLKALSIMGRPVDVEEFQKDGETIWRIKEFELVEISIVEIPMNPTSLFELKSLKRRMNSGEIKRMSVKEPIEGEPSTEDVLDVDVTEEVKEKGLEEEKPEDQNDTGNDIMKALNELLGIAKGTEVRMDGIEERVKKLEEKPSEDKEENEKSFKKTTTLSLSKSALGALIDETVAKSLEVEMPKVLDKYYEKASKEVKTSNEKKEVKEEPKALKKKIETEETNIEKTFERLGLAEKIIQLSEKGDEK